jgi:hypothetical protein
MSNTVQDYQNLLTSEHQKQPNLAAVIAACVGVPVQVQALMSSMIPLFDLATPPVGNQLDIIGEWVGVSRILQVPITGIFFTWDGAASVGWDSGIWQSVDDSTSLVSLPDDVYLTLLLARIAANHWDGTTEGAYTIWSQLFPGFNILIQDNQNMTYTFIVQGAVLDSLTLALLRGGYLPLKPEGVGITEYVVPANTGPLFGWDIQNSFIQGWDDGSWGIELAPT